jgi:hypothetical protein
MTLRRLASGPLIARLLGLHRMPVNQALRKGRFGETVIINGIRYADLTNVEAARDVTFTPEQLAAAAAGKTDGLLIINSETEAA